MAITLYPFGCGLQRDLDHMKSKLVGAGGFKAGRSNQPRMSDALANMVLRCWLGLGEKQGPLYA
jgi:hypothetical protein